MNSKRQIVVSFGIVIASITACGDAPTAPPSVARTTEVAASAQRGPRTIDIGTKVLTFENDTLRDASGHVYWPMSESRVRDIRIHKAQTAAVGKLLRTFDQDTVFQRRIKEAREQGKLHRPDKPSAAVAGAARFAGGGAALCAEADWENNYWACFDQQQAEAGGGGGGGRGGSSCNAIAISIYEWTQTWREDVAEMNMAAVDLVLAGADLFQAILEDNVPGQILAAVRIAEADYRYNTFSSRVNGDVFTLYSLVNEYRSAGC